ncbi:MAG TPA: tRNA lysidine(34) synthetase TilS [Actinomyces sp.]|nr:tRNA lysidine(34) synthetase TilS [Acidobacteriota bacterium]HHT40141.1 tRNA lysidine(34) synthetase TilS [Actinomyces sp.]
MTTDKHLVSDLIGSTPPRHTRAVTLALRHAAERYGLFERPWTVACSGGPDSLALVFAAADLASRKSVPLNAVIVDHGMRAESAREAAQTSALLDEWGIVNQVQRVEVSQSGGLEAAAREARYEALRENTAPGGAILLGHTMDDQAETVLLGLGRGSGTRSLSGMREYVEDSHVWVRPLLSVRRFDTEGMCEELKLTAVEDPSNKIDGGWTTRAGKPLPRVAVRHRVIPELSQALGRDVVPLLARSAELLDQDATALEQIAAQHIPEQQSETRQREQLVAERIRGQQSETPRREQLVANHMPGQQSDEPRLERQLDSHEGASTALVVEELATLPAAIRTRILMDAAISVGSGALEASHVNELDRLVTDYRGGGPIHLPGGVRAWREKTVVDGTVKRRIRILKRS